MSLPNTAIAQQMFSAVAAAGGADLDHSAMVQAIETLAASKVAEG
jgi:2-hydroxy-3-oxopropionate reductase